MERKVGEVRYAKLSFYYLFIVIAFSVTSCKPVEQELKVKVETGAVKEVGINFAVVEGNIIDIGKGNIEKHGFCYNTIQDPTIFDNITQLGARTTVGTFSDSLINLQSDTKYYVRAFAQAADEIFYGEQTSFNTLSPISPEVVIESLSEAKHDTVEVVSRVTDDGGAAITARGICWSLEQQPTVTDEHTSDGTGTGLFNSTATGLLSDTVYYFRAYCTTSVATSYSSQEHVSTPPGNVVITTTAISGITMNTAVSGGTITDDGGSAITSRGVCWSLSQPPTASDNKSVDGTGSGSFSSSMTGLSPGTTYYVRAYAINSTGIYYGEMKTFTTTSQSASLPVLTTTAVSNIAENSAESGGNITDNGGSGVTARGVCWSTSHEPDLSDEFTEDGSGTGSYTSTLTGLSPNTTYYVRAYATNNEGTAYGPEVSFITSQAVYLPTLTTTSVTGITSTSAVSGGTITDDGGSSILARGVCWSTSHNPDLNDTYTSDGTGAGTFVSSITGLASNFTYYVRAYAKNGEGTSYGNEVSFTTNQSLFLPTLTTASVTSITETSAVSGGNITDDGGSTVIARGVCWSTSPGPDLTGDNTTDGSGTGSYTSSLTGLASNTTYYVRAYATNGQGTAYGNEISFATNTSPALPVITTTPVFDIATNSAKSGGSVTNDGGSVIIARGVCWSTTNNPSLIDSYTTDGSETGNFTSLMNGLDPMTLYYVRAYATNGIGTSYGNEVSFTTLALGETVTDLDGNIYHTVIIGTQTWMIENLKVTQFANGDPIPQISSILDWTAASDDAYCYYDNDIIQYKETYGALYNWYTVDDSRGLCPDGWHVSTDEDWDALAVYAGGLDVAGAKLKEAGNDHWDYGLGTNEYGFTALPGGYRSPYGEFYQLGDEGFWWTSRLNSPGYATRYSMKTNYYKLTRSNYQIELGASVRCVKD